MLKNKFQKIFIILFAIALAGCSAKGPTYSSLPDEAKQPRKGMAQLIVYQPVSMNLRSLDIEINRVKGCNLAAGTFFLLDVPPGQTTISSSIWDAPGTSSLTINAKSAHRYSIRIQWDMGKSMGFAVAGIPGGLIAESASSHSGPFLIDSIDEETSKQELAKLKQNTQCH